MLVDSISAGARFGPGFSSSLFLQIHTGTLLWEIDILLSEISRQVGWVIVPMLTCGTYLYSFSYVCSPCLLPLCGYLFILLIMSFAE